jgi:DNA-binding transcriptional LysR family regulator
MDIRALNLNLLVVLDALLAERHVSRAARRLGLSQPAVSNALAQLRVALGDPLFVRAREGMVPTPRALALGVPVRTALAGLERALGDEQFDPARAQLTFVLAASDFVEFVLVPRLLARLSREAPGVRLQLPSWPHTKVPAGLATGEIDLTIGFFPELPAGHHEGPLFPDGFVCVVRKDHPKVGKRLTLDTYLSLLHVLVTTETAGPGVVDIALEKLGRTRTVGLRMSHFLMVPPIIAATDFVAAISERVADAFAGPLQLRVLAPPLPLPRGTVAQVWHQRTHDSAAHRWLRQVVSEVAEDA